MLDAGSHRRPDRARAIDIDRHGQAGALIKLPPVIVLHMVALGGGQRLMAGQPVVRRREEEGVSFALARRHARQFRMHAVEQRRAKRAIDLQHLEIAGEDRSVGVAGIGGFRAASRNVLALVH